MEASLRFPPGRNRWSIPERSGRCLEVPMSKRRGGIGRSRWSEGDVRGGPNEATRCSSELIWTSRTSAPGCSSGVARGKEGKEGVARSKVGSSPEPTRSRLQRGQARTRLDSTRYSGTFFAAQETLSEKQGIAGERSRLISGRPGGPSSDVRNRRSPQEVEARSRAHVGGSLLPDRPLLPYQ